MGVQEHEERSLAEFDAADQQEVERIEAVVMSVLRARRPTTISELSAGVRAQAGDVDNSIIRAAILRLLNRDAFRVVDEEVPAH